MKRPAALALGVISLFATTIPAASASAATPVVVNADYADLSGEYPMGITLDAKGNVYTANYYSTVSKITASGQVTAQWATVPGSTRNYYVLADSARNVYVSSYDTGTVSKFSKSGAHLADYSVGTHPGSMVLATDGSVRVALYQTDQYAHGYVASISSQGAVNQTWKSLPRGFQPWAMTSMKSGGLFLSEYATGNLYGILKHSKGFYGAGVLYATAYYVTRGPDGSFYVANSAQDSITKFSPATNTLTAEWAVLPNGAGPMEMAFDKSGNLYVACSGTDRVAKITSSGGIEADWAVLPTGSNPWGLAMTSKHSMVVSEYLGMKLAKITF